MTQQEIKNVEKTDKKKTTNLKYQRDKDREKVRGIFRFYEVPGGTLRFPFKAYKEDPVERFELKDGQVYTLPLGVAKHLNKNGWYPQYEYVATEGNDRVMGAIPAAPGMTQRVVHKKQRFGFQSLEFVDVEDLNSSEKKVVGVEHVSSLTL